MLSSKTYKQCTHCKQMLDQCMYYGSSSHCKTCQILLRRMEEQEANEYATANNLNPDKLNKGLGSYKEYTRDAIARGVVAKEDCKPIKNLFKTKEGKNIR